LNDVELFEVSVRFSVDPDMPPSRNILHDALEHIQGLMIEASNQEVAEHYAQLVITALERQADE
jgi:hypothetical protein